MSRRFICVCACFIQFVQAASFTPEPSDELLNTPHRGLMVWGTGEGKYPNSLNEKHYPSSIYHVYLPWRLLEPSDQNFDWATIETHYLAPITNLDPNATFVLRVVADYPDGESSEIHFKYTGGENQRDYPLFFEQLGIARKPYSECDGDGPGISLDWNHSAFAQQTTELINELAKKFDNDNRITAIQLGILGMWGEWHQTGCEDWAPKDAIKQHIADAYAKAFKNTPLQIRYAGEQAKGKSFGFYEDAFPRLTALCDQGRAILACEDGGDWNLEWGMNNIAVNAKNNWQVSPISGETPHFFGLKNPQGQTIPSDHWQAMWVNDEQPKVLKLIKDFHFSFLGPAGRHTVKPSSDEEKAKMKTLINTLGYRFQLDTISVTPKDGQAVIAGEIRNVGSAPSYFDTRLVLEWVNSQGQIVQTMTLNKDPNAKLNTIEPGTKRAFSETQALTLPVGKYQLRTYLTMRQPQKNKPIALANKNRDNDKLILGDVEVKAPSKPLVTSFSPQAVGLGTTTLFTINGANLSANLSVTLGGNTCQITQVSSTVMKASCQANVVGNQPFRVLDKTNPVPNAGNWTVTVTKPQTSPEPLVTSFSPQAVGLGTTTLFTINGANLSANLSVTLGGNTCQITQASSTVMKASCQANVVGNQPFRVLDKTTPVPNASNWTVTVIRPATKPPEFSDSFETTP